jgi:hypothetical protein
MLMSEASLPKRGISSAWVDPQQALTDLYVGSDAMWEAYRLKQQERIEKYGKDGKMPFQGISGLVNIKAK